MSTRQIELTTVYRTQVPELSDAWAFVMEHIELSGAHPTIAIAPVWNEENEEEPLGFAVMVQGTTTTERSVDS